jgi:hypothetical protein
MAGQSITALGTIAGERLLTGKEKGPVHPGLFLSLKMRRALSAATVRRGEVGRICSSHMLRGNVPADALIIDLRAAVAL